MIRPLTPVDLIRFMFLNESEKANRAITLDNLLSRRGANLSIMGASRSSIPVRGKSYAWVSSKAGSPNGFVIAKRMSGRQSWNVTHLVLSESGERYLPELLERAAQSAGSCGAEKVFVRLLREDSLVDVARLSGYFPRVPEILFVMDSRTSVSGPEALSRESNVSLRPRIQSDDHSLFRLYNATTPAEVRYAVGMTIDEWLASHEVGRGRDEEFVLTSGGDVIGWLGLTRRAGNGHIAAMIHPDHERQLPSIINFGTKQLDSARTIFSLVPEYQIALQTALTERGFHASSDYVMLIKTMTIKEKEKTRVRVAAPIG